MTFNRILQVALVILSVAISSGCATLPAEKGELALQDNKTAYIIVNFAGSQPVVDARKCDFVCSAWYEFDGGSKGVQIFKKRVGEIFDINYVEIPGKVARFEGNPIKLIEPGIYFYGTIVTNEHGLRMSKAPAPIIFKMALEKYGQELKQLKNHGFDWE